MAVVGCLGDIIFQVSDKTMAAINDVKWSGSARYATHQRHGGNALTEFTGVDPDQYSFEIILPEEYGSSPRTELKKIWDSERAGEALPLTLGTRPYGKYRWTILSHDLTVKNTDSKGNFISGVVSIRLQEYLER